MSPVRLLMIGDVFAKTGRSAVHRVLKKLIRERRIDFVVANGENIAGGVGITPELADDLFDHGVNVITSGNHIWRQKEIRPYIQKNPALLRPCNYISTQPGRGSGVFETDSELRVGVINVSGQVFMDVNPDNPFAAVDNALRQMAGVKLIMVDFHAEATSEKRALASHLDGRVTLLAGTHTHVQTADEQISAKGTAFISDVGMTGPHESIIGMSRETVMKKFVTGLPEPFKPATAGARFQGCLVEADPATGQALTIARIDIPLADD